MEKIKCCRQGISSKINLIDWTQPQSSPKEQQPVRRKNLYSRDMFKCARQIADPESVRI